MNWVWPIPIIQAPIGSGAGPDLCASISNAGALGSISLTWRTPELARQLIDAVRQRTSRPFMANFVLHFPPVCLEAALQERVPILTFSWGDPSPYTNQVRKSGARFGIQVTSGESAKRMLELEPDFLIVQGSGAGGHVQGHAPLIEVLDEVIEFAGPVPVFAAGGLASGSDLAGVMRVGASGGVFGTRFLASVECEAHPSYKDKLVDSTAQDTVLTHCFDIGWPNAPHRVLRNSTFVNWERNGCPNGESRPNAGEIVAYTGSSEPIYRYEDAMPRHDTSGNWEAMCLYAGTSVTGVQSVQLAADIVSELWKTAQMEL